MPAPGTVEAPDAQQQMLTLLRRSPQTFGLDRSRWTLALVREVVDALADFSLSGVWRLLHRLGIHLKRGRSHLHSPDPDYVAKLDYLKGCLEQMRQDPEHVVVLYEDELSFYRQPTLASDWEASGAQTQPLARRSYHADTTGRVAAVLDAHSGRVIYRQRAKTTTAVLLGLYQDICRSYPAATTIYLVQDNWPVHFHPDLLRHLEPQHWPWPFYRPPSWPDFDEADRVDAPLALQLVCLPTYAPWLNPIEKLWRRLYQNVLHLHRHSDQWDELKQRVCTFLDQFQDGSQPLLQYVGLYPE